MRMAHIESSMDWGGQELRILEQTEWLNQHDHQAWIIARPGSAIARHAMERNVPLFELDIRGSANPATFRKLKQFLQTHKIELLDCHGNRDSTYGAYIKWFSGLPVVRSRHVTDAVRSSRIQRLLWRHGNDGIVVTAGKVREILCAGKLSSPERVHVAAAGVDEARFSPERDGRAMRARLGIGADDYVIANVGMIRPDKGQLFFIRACREILLKHPSVTCIQLGEATGQTKDYKAQVLAAAGGELGSRIRFLGYQGDIENWLAMADMIVIASVATEAQTRLVAQAFLMKKNVVATTTGGLPEMITHEDTGLLCEPGSEHTLAVAMERVLLDKVLAERLRESAYQHARQYMSFEFMMKGMLYAYQQAAKRVGRNLSQ